MTPGILHWLKKQVRPHVPIGAKVLEIGALNVNGSARSVLPNDNWLGIDRVPGRGVDLVVNAVDFFESNTIQYDLIVACECYEHDPRWWITDQLAKSHLVPGSGLYVVTVPAIGFPFHDFGGDYYRFTTMAFTSVIFEGMDILDLQTIRGDHPGENTIVGVATNRVK